MEIRPSVLSGNILKHVLRPKENHSNFAYLQGYVKGQINLNWEEGRVLQSMG